MGAPGPVIAPVFSGISLPNGIASGEVTTTTALLWTRSAMAGTVRFEIAIDEAFQSVVYDRTKQAESPFLPIKLRATGLEPGTQYHLRATGPDGFQVIGKLKTAAAPNQHAGLRFGVSGDSRGELKPFTAVANVPERELDFFVLLGDTIYADYPSPIAPALEQATTLRAFLGKHDEVNSASSSGAVNFLGELRSSCAVLATIDDHEVTNDFAGGATPASHPLFAAFEGAFAFINETSLFEAGLKAFQLFHPLADRYYGDTANARTAFKRKLYRTQTYGQDAAVFLLDARSFRDQPLPEPDLFDPLSIGQFLAASFDPARTMLGKAQVQELLADLLAADQAGVLWKFVFVPEPIQNLGVTAAPDRFEGYAAERTEILDFITQQAIDHVVFVAADIHGTLVNDLYYQLNPAASQIQTTAFEITTGAIAFDAPFGPTVVEIAAAQGLVAPEELAFYESLPIALKDSFLEGLINLTIAPLGYDSLGLEQSAIQAELLEGSWTNVHTWGWSEFEIDAQSGVLDITTYGLVPYLQDTPEVLQRIRVTP